MTGTGYQYVTDYHFSNTNSVPGSVLNAVGVSTRLILTTALRAALAPGSSGEAQNSAYHLDTAVPGLQTSLHLLRMCVLGGSGRWLSYVDPCHPRGRPAWSSRPLALASPSTS